MMHNSNEIDNNNNNNMNNNDDDENILDPSEQTLRPVDNALNQQRVQAWHPILDPVWVIIGLFYFGIILIPVGLRLRSMQSNVIEMIVSYDDYYNYTFENSSSTSSSTSSSSSSSSIIKDDNICGIGHAFNLNKSCTISFTTTQNMIPPIFLHYQIKNFHQNHRKYVKSKDQYQLYGKVGGQDSISGQLCNPLNKLGNITLHPCGLIANTLFNDYYTLIDGKDAYGNDLILIEDGIAWQSDIDYVYNQPNGFNYSECPTGCTDTNCCLPGDSCITPYYNKKDDKCYRYYYPNDDTTQYLYETYPDIISPIEGVTNEHFMVWMRVATLPEFRKLYGYINQPILANTTITFQVNANFNVVKFKGSKSLVLGTTTIFGGKNKYLWPIFVWVGVYCLIVGSLFTLKHLFKPRKLADPKYLHYKED